MLSWIIGYLVQKMVQVKNGQLPLYTPQSALQPAAPPAIRSGMSATRTHAQAPSVRSFAGETLRALSSTLLLLGLIGDRRVR